MMSHLADPITKASLRERFRAYRTQLTPADVADKSTAVLRHVATLPEVQNAETVHCYWPLAGRGEIDVRPLIERLHDKGVRVVLPEIADGQTPTLRHRRYAGPESLRTNHWNLREPVGTELVAPEALDVVIVPAFGAGRNGHRIGHGFGYYDAFLAPLGVPTIALVYDACLVDAVPAEAHDVPMSMIVTEQHCLRLDPTNVESSVHPSLDPNG